MFEKRKIAVVLSMLLVLQLLLIPSLFIEPVYASTHPETADPVFSIVHVDPTTEEMTVKITYASDSMLRQHKVDTPKNGGAPWRNDDAKEVTIKLNKQDTLYARSKGRGEKWNEASFLNTGTPPDFSIIRTLSKNSILKGQSIDITYTLNPLGHYNNIRRQPIEIVYVVDMSKSMDDSIGDGKNKMRAAKDVVKSSIDSIEALGASDKVSVIAFNRYSKVVCTPTTNYDTVKNEVEKIEFDDGYSFDSGTNYEAGLRAAKNILTTGTHTKYIIFVTDGFPNFYIDNFDPDASYSGDYLYSYALYNDFYYWKGWKRYFHWAAAYSSLYRTAGLGTVRGLDPNEYTYKNESKSGKSYTDAKAMATELATSGIILNTVGVGSGSEVDMSFLRQLAAQGGGNGYQAENIADLNNAFTSISDSIKQQQISSIVISEKLPTGAVLSPNSQNAASEENGVIKVAMPPLVYENGKVPAPVSATISLTFHQVGSYQLEGEVNYNDFKGDLGRKTLGSATVTVGESISGGVKINGDATYMTDPSRMVTLSFTRTGPITKMKIANSNTGLDSAQWENFVESKSWRLEDGEDTKTVYVRLCDSLGNVIETSDSIFVDTIAPTADIKQPITYNDTKTTATITLENKSTDAKVTNNSGLETYTFTQNGTFTFQLIDNAGNTGSVSYTVSDLSTLLNIDFSNSYRNNEEYRTKAIEKGVIYVKLRFSTTSEVNNMNVEFSVQNFGDGPKSDMTKLTAFHNSTVTLLDSSNKKVRTFNTPLSVISTDKDSLLMNLTYTDSATPLPAGDYEMIVMIQDKGGLKKDGVLKMSLTRVNGVDYDESSARSGGTLYIDVVMLPKII